MRKESIESETCPECRSEVVPMLRLGIPQYLKCINKGQGTCAWYRKLTTKEKRIVNMIENESRYSEVAQYVRFKQLATVPTGVYALDMDGFIWFIDGEDNCERLQRVLKDPKGKK